MIWGPGLPGADGATGPQGPEGPAGPAGTGGAVVQFVSASTTTTTTATTTYAAITGISATITPSSASNKIVVTVSIPYNVTVNATVQMAGFRVKRGATVIWESFDDASGTLLPGFGVGGATNNNQRFVFALTHVDSPASTASLTYTVEGRIRTSLNGGAGTFVTAGTTAQPPGQIVLMEVTP